jgi:hypothetical protein
VRIASIVSRLSLLLSLAAAGASGASELQVQRLTHDLVADLVPQIEGSRIAWLRGQQVHLLEDGKAVPLTQGSARHSFLRVTLSLVAWRTCELFNAFDEISCWGPHRVFVFDGETVAPLTAPDVDVSALDAAGSRLVWVASGEVFLWEGGTPQQLTRRYLEGLPLVWDQLAVSGGTVVWAAGGDVFRNQSGETVPMTDEAYPGKGDVSDLDVSEDRIVWSDTVGTDREIFYFDGEEVVQLTDDDVDQFSPRISGSRVVWQVIGLDGEDDVELHLFDGEVSAPLTDNDFHDHFPQISGANVVWVGRSSDVGAPGEIYWYDGASIRRVTENDYEDGVPSISGSRFVWYGCPDFEIKGCRSALRPYGILPHAELFLAPEPGPWLRALAAGACVAGLASRRRGREARRARRLEPVAPLGA